jgi:quinolinate synthase
LALKQDLVQEINELKKKHNAAILCHYYEEGDIQDIADHIGDSLFLAQIGQKISNPVVVMAGVVFMAESVKLLSPEKIVLAPDLNAGCSLVNESPYKAYEAWRNQHKDALCVSYVNSSIEVKALSDVVCTSSNAEKIIEAIPKDRKILFGPDKNLGGYLQRKTGRDMVLWDGTCQVHVLFSAQKLFELKAKHPKAIVIAHPECDEQVLIHADVIGSTSRLLKEVKDYQDKGLSGQEFIVATEIGIFHEMQKQNPTAKLIQAPFRGHCACNECPYMKMNTLEKIRDALKNLSPQIEVPEALRKPALESLDKMMKLTNGQNVTWAKTFESPL